MKFVLTMSVVLLALLCTLPHRRVAADDISGSPVIDIQNEDTPTSIKSLMGTTQPNCRITVRNCKFSMLLIPATISNGCSVLVEDVTIIGGYIDFTGTLSPGTSLTLRRVVVHSPSDYAALTVASSSVLQYSSILIDSCTFVRQTNLQATSFAHSTCGTSRDIITVICIAPPQCQTHACLVGPVNGGSSLPASADGHSNSNIRQLTITRTTITLNRTTTTFEVAAIALTRIDTSGTGVCICWNFTLSDSTVTVMGEETPAEQNSSSTLSGIAHAIGFPPEYKPPVLSIFRNVFQINGRMYAAVVYHSLSDSLSLSWSGATWQLRDNTAAIRARHAFFSLSWLSSVFTGSSNLVQHYRLFDVNGNNVTIVARSAAIFVDLATREFPGLWIDDLRCNNNTVRIEIFAAIASYSSFLFLTPNRVARSLIIAGNRMTANQTTKSLVHGLGFYAVTFPRLTNGSQFLFTDNDLDVVQDFHPSMWKQSLLRMVSFYYTMDKLYLSMDTSASLLLFARNKLSAVTRGFDNLLLELYDINVTATSAGSSANSPSFGAFRFENNLVSLRTPPGAVVPGISLKGLQLNGNFSAGSVIVKSNTFTLDLRINLERGSGRFGFVRILQISELTWIYVGGDLIFASNTITITGTQLTHFYGVALAFENTGGGTGLVELAGNFIVTGNKVDNSAMACPPSLCPASHINADFEYGWQNSRRAQFIAPFGGVMRFGGSEFTVSHNIITYSNLVTRLESMDLFVVPQYLNFTRADVGFHITNNQMRYYTLPGVDYESAENRRQFAGMLLGCSKFISLLFLTPAHTVLHNLVISHNVVSVTRGLSLFRGFGFSDSVKSVRFSGVVSVQNNSISCAADCEAVDFVIGNSQPIRSALPSGSIYVLNNVITGVSPTAAAISALQSVSNAFAASTYRFRLVTLVVPEIGSIVIQHNEVSWTGESTNGALDVVNINAAMGYGSDTTLFLGRGFFFEHNRVLLPMRSACMILPKFRVPGVTISVVNNTVTGPAPTYTAAKYPDFNTLLLLPYLIVSAPDSLILVRNNSVSFDCGEDSAIASSVSFQMRLVAIGRVIGLTTFALGSITINETGHLYLQVRDNHQRADGKYLQVTSLATIVTPLIMTPSASIEIEVTGNRGVIIATQPIIFLSVSVLDLSQPPSQPPQQQQVRRSLLIADNSFEIGISSFFGASCGTVFACSSARGEIIIRNNSLIIRPQITFLSPYYSEVIVRTFDPRLSIGIASVVCVACTAILIQQRTVAQAVFGLASLHESFVCEDNLVATEFDTPTHYVTLLLTPLTAASSGSSLYLRAINNKFRAPRASFKARDPPSTLPGAPTIVVASTAVPVKTRFAGYPAVFSISSDLSVPRLVTVNTPIWPIVYVELGFPCNMIEFIEEPNRGAMSSRIKSRPLTSQIVRAQVPKSATVTLLNQDNSGPAADQKFAPCSSVTKTPSVTLTRTISSATKPPTLSKSASLVFVPTTFGMDQGAAASMMSTTTALGALAAISDPSAVLTAARAMATFSLLSCGSTARFNSRAELTLWFGWRIHSAGGVALFSASILLAGSAAVAVGFILERRRNREARNSGLIADDDDGEQEMADMSSRRSSSSSSNNRNRNRSTSDNDDAQNQVLLAHEAAKKRSALENALLLAPLPDFLTKASSQLVPFWSVAAGVLSARDFGSAVAGLLPLFLFVVAPLLWYAWKTAGVLNSRNRGSPRIASSLVFQPTSAPSWAAKVARFLLHPLGRFCLIGWFCWKTDSFVVRDGSSSSSSNSRGRLLLRPRIVRDFVDFQRASTILVRNRATLTKYLGPPDLNEERELQRVTRQRGSRIRSRSRNHEHDGDSRQRSQGNSNSAEDAGYCSFFSSSPRLRFVRQALCPHFVLIAILTTIVVCFTQGVATSTNSRDGCQHAMRFVAAINTIFAFVVCVLRPMIVPLQTVVVVAIELTVAIVSILAAALVFDDGRLELAEPLQIVCANATSIASALLFGIFVVRTVFCFKLCKCEIVSRTDFVRRVECDLETTRKQQNRRGLYALSGGGDAVSEFHSDPLLDSLLVKPPPPPVKVATRSNARVETTSAAKFNRNVGPHEPVYRQSKK